VLLEDARGADRHLRVTWHPEAGQCNVSTWHGDVCSGAVRLRPDDVATLVGLLAEGMAGVIAETTSRTTAEPARASTGDRLRTWLARLRHARRAA
jgi:hypothetical protein